MDTSHDTFPLAPAPAAPTFTYIPSLTGQGKDPGFFAFGFAQGFGWWKRSYPEALHI